MNNIYTVIENGVSYPKAYKTYELAIAAVKEKHQKHIEELILMCKYLPAIECILAFINIPEDLEFWITYLYIETDFYIEIHRLSIA